MKKESESRMYWVLVALVVVLSVVLVGQGMAISGIHKKLDDLSAHDTQRVRITQKTDEKDETSAAAKTPAAGRVVQDPFALVFDDEWDPFKEMRSMQERIDHMFDNAFSRFHFSDGFDSLLDDYAFSPDINIEDKGDEFLVTVNLPGAEESDLDVKVEDQTLTISGEVKTETREEDKGKLLLHERSVGKFRRVVTLPEPVKSDDIKSERKKGVLYLTIPKAED